MPTRWKSLPSTAIVQYWLDYDQFTGRFVWKREPAKIGRRVGHGAGSTTPRGYRVIGIPGFYQISAQTLAWIYCKGDIPDDLEVDHIDGNPANNAISNLRLATSSQQKMNRRVQSNNRCGLKGAYYHEAHKGKKWRSQIKVEGRCVFLGYFHTPEEAHKVYCEAASFYFGEFARAA